MFDLDKAALKTEGLEEAARGLDSAKTGNNAFVTFVERIGPSRFSQIAAPLTASLPFLDPRQVSSTRPYIVPWRVDCIRYPFVTMGVSYSDCSAFYSRAHLP